VVGDERLHVQRFRVLRMIPQDLTHDFFGLIQSPHALMLVRQNNLFGDRGHKVSNHQSLSKRHREDVAEA
jgi:hypothetical protein